jgi:hypothetical protein
LRGMRGRRRNVRIGSAPRRWFDQNASFRCILAADWGLLLAGNAQTETKRSDWRAFGVPVRTKRIHSLVSLPAPRLATR